MRTAVLSPEDEEYLQILEHRRDHEMHTPLLSSFRVLALFAYEDLDGNHKHVIGANCECANIGGALCAERSAICQLQLLPVRRVRKVYIVSDADVCLTPGTLCREFLSSSAYFTRSTPFISRATKCKPCITTLEELYPFPNVYDRVKRDDVLQYAQDFCDRAVAHQHGACEPAVNPGCEHSAFVAQQLQLMSVDEQKLYLAALAATVNDKRDDLYPVRYAAAVLFRDGSIRVSWQHKTLEYGSSLDAISKLIPFIEEKHAPNLVVKHTEDANAADAINASEPLLIAQVDQFGILHAPFARVRAYFFEFDFKDLHVLVHDRLGQLNRVNMGMLVSESPDCIATSTAQK
ncbi:TPA: hypothetical protein N0F65_001512 [Lagenidium giganteum]|uniref:Cytidine deaminase n=1 Tax=Lagenidium giganteum TaxID=4803 RepID=A0AAV2Z3H9_9STRA|nr:TPA: hypothetical protein N0F65_001512 [Lagenidium giganteum]